MPVIYSVTNLLKRHVHGGHVKWIVNTMSSFYHIIPEKCLCCFGCATQYFAVIVLILSINRLKQFNDNLIKTRRIRQ